MSAATKTRRPAADDKEYQARVLECLEGMCDAVKSIDANVELIMLRQQEIIDGLEMIDINQQSK